MKKNFAFIFKMPLLQWQRLGEVYSMFQISAACIDLESYRYSPRLLNLAKPFNIELNNVILELVTSNNVCIFVD